MSEPASFDAVGAQSGQPRRRAAQYVRMSTEHQQYSTENQADVIREFATRHGFDIAATFEDSGKSGLQLKGRDSLKNLLDIVEAGKADFDTILVYDVSRWGRFQDADESAYYEYRCKRAGINVEYCAEQFANDGSPTATIIKSVKRAMAGEYSRELSAKVFKGQCRLIQLGYSSLDSDTAAVGTFLSVDGGERSLLFLGEKPSAESMGIHGRKWNELNPAEHLLAGGAAAVIVNPANKIESLTLDQIRSIFSGAADDWKMLGSAASRINVYGLRPGDPAAGIFYKECLPAEKFKRVTIQKDTAEALAAVSMDPQAIAFVDLSAIPATGQTVKVLPISMKMSGNEIPIAPTLNNIKTAMYPLSRRVYLYVHPKAGDTAKAFAKFIATCGSSEASPYADPVKAVMETYEKNGLIPLADAAIERKAKDAAAAAKRQAEQAATMPAKAK